MSIWFLFAISNALAFSIHNAYSKYAVSRGRFSKFTVVFCSSLISSVILFAAAYFMGLPSLDSTFWLAVVITGVINSVTGPMLLLAYQYGEFSSVFSMSLLTPVFLLLTSFFILGEIPSLIGASGVVVTILGLWVLTKSSADVKEELVGESGKINRGNLLAIGIALLWSISVNFDKLAAQHSNVFFAPASSLAIMALTSGAYLLFVNRRNLLSPSEIKIPNLWLMVPLGILLAASSLLFNAALLVGLASYTIAVKRMGILFGVLWGWLFFKERNIGKKLFGAAIAVAGVILILFS